MKELRSDVDLNWLFEMRNIGDYGGTVHVEQAQAERAILAAEKFLSAVRNLMDL